MLTINKLIPGGRGLARTLLARGTQVELDWERRSHSRCDVRDDAGRDLGVFLPRGSVMRGGDVLVAEDGSLVRVQAAAQAVLVVRHCPDHGAPSDLARAAYHLGNRHVAVEIQPDHLKIEPDPVLAALLQRMHLVVTEASAPFEPESGAYQSAHAPHTAATAAARDHDHDHGHGHGDGHAKTAAHVHAPASAPSPAPAASHSHSHGHVHGPGCQHDH